MTPKKFKDKLLLRKYYYTLSKKIFFDFNQNLLINIKKNPKINKNLCQRKVFLKLLFANKLCI